MDTKIINTKSLGRRHTLVITADLSVSEIGPWITRAYSEIVTYLAKKGAAPAGPPFARYHRLGNDRFHVEAGFPVGAPIEGEGEVRGSMLPAGTAAIITHIGPYDEMEPTYATLESWIESRGAVAEGDAWEVYHSEPTDPPETWRTVIYQPFRAA